MVKVRVVECDDNAQPVRERGVVVAHTSGFRAFAEANDGADAWEMGLEIREALAAARRGTIPAMGLAFGGGAQPIYRLTAWRERR